MKNYSNGSKVESRLSLLSLTVIVGGLLAVPAGNAFSQSSDPLGLSVGDSKVVPSLGLEYIQNNNVFLTSTNTTDTSGIAVTPTIKWLADKGATSISAVYSGAYGQFEEESLDFTDHSLALGVGSTLSSKLRANASLSLKRTHDELGTNLTIGQAALVNDQVIFDDTNFNASVAFGAVNAKGNIRAGVGYRDYNPVNLESISRGAEYDRISPFVEFSLRVSPDTRWTTGVGVSDIDYLEGNRDRKDVSLYTGLNFAPTGKLSGGVRVAFSESRFDEFSSRDTEEVLYNTSLSYRPVDYALFTLSAAREFDLGTISGGAGQETISDRFGLSWRHEWSSRIYHRASLSYQEQNRECPTDSYRTTLGGIEVNYFLKRWLEVGLGFTGDTRKGGICDPDPALADRLDFDRQKIGVKLLVTL